MILQQEYSQRHKLEITEVHHTLYSGHLFLKTDVEQSDLGSRWVLVSLIWRDNTQHPGQYEIKIQVPVYNGYTKQDLWENVRGYPPSLSLQYEEIDDFFREFAIAHGTVNAIVVKPEVSLTTWEIFLYTHDELIANKRSPRLSEFIEASIDFDLSIEDRYHSYLEAINLLIADQAVLFEKYEMSIHIYTKKNLGWLARLINGD